MGYLVRDELFFSSEMLCVTPFRVVVADQVCPRYSSRRTGSLVGHQDASSDYRDQTRPPTHEGERHSALRDKLLSTVA
jgi:hypothetical protein